jgi:hypothetical protein
MVALKGRGSDGLSVDGIRPGRRIFQLFFRISNSQPKAGPNLRSFLGQPAEFRKVTLVAQGQWYLQLPLKVSGLRK